jgi:hypothetical protein
LPPKSPRLQGFAEPAWLGSSPDIPLEIAMNYQPAPHPENVFPKIGKK